jgi:hypothetical protein
MVKMKGNFRYFKIMKKPFEGDVGTLKSSNESLMQDWT